MIKHVLVVDDSKSARFMLSKMLQKQGLETDMAESAEEALGWLAEHVPDAIFIDHMMPGMDGLQATDEIKKDPRFAATPVVLFTSKEGEAYVAEARSHGAVGVLPKPPSGDAIRRILDEIAAATPPGIADAPAAAPAPVAASAEAVAAAAREAVDAALEAHLNGRVAALVDERIAALRDQLTPALPAAPDSSALEGALDGLLTAREAGLVGRAAEALEPRLAALREELASAAPDDAVAALRSDVVRLDTATSGLGERIDGLGAGLAELRDAAGAAASGDDGALREQLDAVQARLTELGEQLHPVDGRIYELKRAFDDLQQTAGRTAMRVEMLEEADAPPAAAAGIDETALATAVASASGPIEARLVKVEASQDTLDARLGQLVEQLVENTARKHAQAIAAVVRKDATEIAEELGAKHAAALREEIAQATARPPTDRVGSGHVAWQPLLVGGIALAVAVTALLVALF